LGGGGGSAYKKSLAPPPKQQLTMLKIAITGGAGSGKSTVARMFKELGAPGLDADAAARDAVAKGAPAWEEIRREFGPEYFLPDGALDRAKMAVLVFKDKKARARLNRIVHPRVAQKMARLLKDLEQAGAPLVLVEVPLLFELGLAAAYDRIILVFADRETQIRRLSQRDGKDTAEIDGLLQAQWPLSAKIPLAHYLIDNQGDLATTRRQVEEIWPELQKISLTKSVKKVTVFPNLP
jgi:dephospho-CoA kinase